MAKKMVKLGDVATYINGYAFKPEDRGKIGLPIIRIQDLTGNSYDLGFYDGMYPQKIEINNGDILISWSASLGVYIWNRGKALLNQHIFKVEFDKMDIDKKYFVFAVRHKLKEMGRKTHGATMKHIVKKDFDGTEIPYPPYKEQVEIANNLDKIFRIIELQNQELKLLDELVRSRFVELFGDMIINHNGWENVLLGEVCDVRDGTHDSPQYYSEGYPLVTSKNVTGGKIEFIDCSLICEEDFNKINQRSKVDYGDILMPMIGTVGNPVIVDIDEKFAIKNVALIKFRDNSVVINSFIKALLESDYFDRAVISKVRGGTQKFISLGDIRKLEIYLPPIELQNQFADFVHQIDKSKFGHLSMLTMMKSACDQQTFIYP
ncbi:MAG: restriction endonuclease subunit S [Eubacterium sp.]